MVWFETNGSLLISADSHSFYEVVRNLNSAVELPWKFNPHSCSKFLMCVSRTHHDGTNGEPSWVP